MTTNNEIFMNPYTNFGFKKLFGTEPNKDTCRGHDQRSHP